MSFFDTIVFVGMIALTVIVGVVSSRKVRQADEYLMAGRSLNKLQTAFSMAATDFGGSGLVAAVGYCYLAGLGGMWWNLAAAPAFLFVGLFLAKKLNRLQVCTVPGYFRERYSKSCQVITSVMHFLAAAAVLSTQFTISSVTLQAISGLDPTITVVVTSLLVVILTLTGGLRSVVNTDATLFIFIVVSIICCVPISLKAAGGFSSVAAALPEGFLSLGSIGFWEPLSWVLMCMFLYSTNQHYVQRIVSAKNPATARFSTFFTAGFYVVISVALGVIGITARVLLPGLASMNDVFPRLLVSYFPSGLLGLGVAGVFAATISTGSSLLHSAATIFMSDILPSFASLTSNASLRLNRVVTLLVAAASLVLSLRFPNIISIIYISSLFYGTSAFFPLLLGINCRWVTAKAALWSIFGAVASGLLWELLVSGKAPFWGAFPSNIVSALISLLLLVTVSWLENRGSSEPRDLLG